MRLSVRPLFELVLPVAAAILVAVPLPAQEATPPGAETPERLGVGLSYKMVFVAGHYLRSFKSLVEELDLTNNGFAITAGVRF